MFEFNTGGASRLFHSRRVGLTPAGEPVPVLGGARLVGRAGSWDVGVLGMRTGDAGEIPGETFGVVRLRRPVLNPYSSAGLMATSRTGGGAHNHALGADASLRVTGDEYLTLRWAGSVDEADPAGTGLAERSHLGAAWERRTGRGLFYRLEYTRSGEDYRPDLGFLPRRDFTSANLLANWYRFTDRHPVFRRV